MGSWWVADLLHHDKVLLISWVVWVIGSICLHELAHGWMAIRFGDRTPIELGHMTWNPLVHMGKLSLLLFAVVGIAWGVMPVNPSRMRGRHARAWVAFAGPLMNLTLAAASVLICAAWIGYAQGVSEPAWSNVQKFFRWGAILNVTLFCFNLIPVPPLDGSTILSEFSSGYRRLRQDPRFAQFSFFGLLLAFWFLGAPLFEFAAASTSAAIAGVHAILPGASPVVN